MAPDLNDRSCFCRKPKPGLVVLALDALLRNHPEEEYPRSMGLMVGDRQEDADCALNAGLRFVWASEWRRGETLL